MNTDTDSSIDACIERAATSVGSVWPLHSFVTANPLAGFEDRPFHEAVQQGERLFGADGYPSAAMFRAAWESGQIDTETLVSELAEHGYDDDPEALLDRMAVTDDRDDEAESSTPMDHVDRLVSKWLAAFLDQGAAKWSMPEREQGFYHAFRAVARYDRELPDRSVFAALPDDPVDAISELVDDYPTDQWVDIFEYHLAALPGWTGLIKQRVADGDAWQDAYPITLAGYLAARLTLADQLGAPLTPPNDTSEADETVPLPEVWLTAWEATYRTELVDAISDASAAMGADEDASAATADGRPDAQLVFCIDTRSEVLRRHLESAGAYETHGYAGFFGIPMRYEGYRDAVSVDACPPIVDAQHRIVDRPRDGDDANQMAADRWSDVHETAESTIKALRTNAATAFSFVESAGSAYGAALAARTLLPERVYDLFDALDRRVPDTHEFCEPTVDHDPTSGGSLPQGLTFEEQVSCAATAFELMGWETFSRLVVFTGHASQTTNNPFASSLDCGACAGNPGGPNARVLARICNDDSVQEALKERGFDIPSDTVFLAAEHNTTTDEVTLYDKDVPESHQDDAEKLRSALAAARAGATAERAETFDGATTTGTGVRETERRAADWAETRPEWGLAGNAGFVIGPRDLTSGLDLAGRSFLHSYDWRTDSDGDALAAIMAGPMVVTQWINTQYYFATVDNAVYGSGSKITHNAVGNVGVYQGNGGDLMSGLPLQSVMAADDVPRHQPLRLSTVIHAPVERVRDIVAANDQVSTLLDNGWLSLTVVDPTQDHQSFHYEGEGEWSGSVTVEEPMTTKPLIAADD